MTHPPFGPLDDPGAGVSVAVDDAEAQAGGVEIPKGLGAGDADAQADEIPKGLEAGALRGSVERITYHNPDTGFCVLRVQARGHRKPVTVVGHAPAIAAGGQSRRPGVSRRPGKDTSPGT